MDDAQFLKQKLLTEAQLQECLATQEKLKTEGFPATLEEIALKKQFIKKGIPGYTLMAKLGKGGMGVVYKARQNSVDRIVAIKVLSSDLTSDRSFVQRFMNEAKAIAKLQHRNIISVFDAGEAGGNYYFAMEFIEGKDLAQIVKESGPLSEDQARKILLQAAEALRYLHSRGMIHRDIKPENIMIDKAGVLKLGDFGLAKMPTNSGLTDPGAVMGTPRYISPEQAQGASTIDIRSDLYSLGATLHFLLTGKPPYDGPTPMAIVLKHVNDPLPRPANVSEPMLQLIHRLMQKDPSKRLQTPAELIATLQGRAVPKKKLPMLPLALGMTSLVLAVVALGLLWPSEEVKPKPPTPKPPPPPAVVQKQPEPEKPPPKNEGLELMKAKRWAEAAALLKGVPEFEVHYKNCLFEIETASLVEAIQKASDEKRWEEVEQLGERFQRMESVTAGENRASIEVLVSRAKKERETDRLLMLAQGQADAGKWKECLETLNKLEESPKTEALRKRCDEARKAAAEQEAERLWNRAVLASNAKEYNRAKALYEEFMRDAVGTMFYATHRDDAARHLNECDDSLATEKENKAKEIWDEIQKAKSAKDWSKVTELLDRLDRSFQETELYKKNAAAMADLRKSADKGAREQSKTIDDFESGIGKWYGHSDTVEKPKLAEVSDTREGKKGLRVTFGRMTKESDSAMAVRAIGGLPKATTAFKLWIKPQQSTLRAQDLVLILLQDDEKGGTLVWVAVIKIEPNWKEYSIPVKELYVTKVSGTVSGKEFRPERVKVLGIGKFGRQPILESYLMDDIRVETKD